MILNFETLGFTVKAKTMPETCMACPFWLFERETLEGMCFLTGRIMPTDGIEIEERMDDCPIIQEGKV